MKKKVKKTVRKPQVGRPHTWIDSDMISFSWFGNPEDKPAPVAFVAVYKENTKDRDGDNNFEDAWETFTSRKEVTDWLKRDKNASSIRVFEVKAEYRSTAKVSLLKVRKTK